MFCIFFHPQMPTIQAHDGIIKINTGFSRQMILETQINIDDRIDQTDRVNKNIFFPAIPNTYDTGKYGNIFQWSGVLHTRNELLKDFLEGQNVYLL